jgi:hypothetical protein
MQGIRAVVVVACLVTAPFSYTETLSELAVGQSVVLKYETRFENRVSAVETVTPIKDARGSW